MSDQDEFDPDTFDPEAPQATPAELREAAKRGKKILSENAQLKRELAFAKAKIDIEDPKMRYFVKGYDGDLTPEAIAAAAVEAGFIEVTPQQPPQVAPPEASAQQRIMAASAGGIVEDASVEAAKARMAEALEQGGIDSLIDVARSYGIRIADD